MGNIFSSKTNIKKIYDLKGSTYKRITKDLESKAPLKDLNILKENFKLGLKRSESIHYKT